MHHLFSNSSENPASGPLSSVPAIGCEEIQETFLGTFFSIKPITFSLTEPTSVNMDPLFNESFTFLVYLGMFLVIFGVVFNVALHSNDK